MLASAHDCPQTTGAFRVYILYDSVMQGTTDAAAESPTEVDESLIKWMLSLTPEQRLAALQGAIDSAHELAGLARAARPDK